MRRRGTPKIWGDVTARQESQRLFGFNYAEGRVRVGGGGEMVLKKIGCPIWMNAAGGGGLIKCEGDLWMLIFRALFFQIH